VPLRPKRTGTSHCWPILRCRRKVGRHWLVVLRFCHILGRSWSEQKCAFGALPRPGQQTYCAIVKVDNGGDGHFQAKVTVQCLTSFGGFLPDQPQTQSSSFCKHCQRWHVTYCLQAACRIVLQGFLPHWRVSTRRSQRHRCDRHATTSSSFHICRSSCKLHHA
jgi:hypothetical protein